MVFAHSLRGVASHGLFSAFTLSAFLALARGFSSGTGAPLHNVFGPQILLCAIVAVLLLNLLELNTSLLLFLLEALSFFGGLPDDFGNNGRIGFRQRATGYLGATAFFFFLAALSFGEESFFFLFFGFFSQGLNANGFSIGYVDSRTVGA